MDNPHYLLLKLDAVPSPQVVEIDLDERGWLQTYDEQLFHRTGEWHLVRKNGKSVVFSLRVNEGDQPYYTARVIGVVGHGETRAYSIGKKTQRYRRKKAQWVENEDNLWVLEWGQICGGTDVEYFAKAGIMSGVYKGV